MLTLYGMKSSGNCYKVELALAQLGIAYQWVDVDSAHAETRTREYLALNPNGKVPLLKMDDGRPLAESNAILFYLTEGTKLLPDDRWHRAQTLQWLFFEQYSHEPCIAVARFICRWLASDYPRREELPKLLERGYAALAVMEHHLQAREFFLRFRLQHRRHRALCVHPRGRGRRIQPVRVSSDPCMACARSCPTWARGDECVAREYIGQGGSHPRADKVEA